MAEEYELRVTFKIVNERTLIQYALRQHGTSYPRGTKYPPPVPRDVAAALADAVIDYRTPSVEDLGLELLSSTSGPIRSDEETVVERVRLLYAHTGGRGPFWEVLMKLLEAAFSKPSSRHGRPRRSD
jgi:hypothetical protein